MTKLPCLQPDHTLDFSSNGFQDVREENTGKKNKMVEASIDMSFSFHTHYLLKICADRWSDLSGISLVIALVSMELDEQHAKLLGEARVVPPLLAMASGMDSYNSEVLQKLTPISDGTQFFVDESGIELEVEPIITNLLAFQ
ncbi:hypothetical protein Vadar_029488 [Vaccinium darrowii]|uniref:Uncharacterized protein n=1 Tax=Vaccinium darrowii TaxID=229202 RepID=A0ACB7ZEY9_9ERIC|nr:hypothetical protein Vadar_029488 [Vaccinium darrowii]